MRFFYPLLVGASLSLAPAISLASTPGSTVERSAPKPALEAPAAPTTPSAAPQVPAKRSSTDQKRYAAREQASPDAAAYRGGDTLVIGASAATAILAVVLLVVLL